MALCREFFCQQPLLKLIAPFSWHVYFAIILMEQRHDFSSPLFFLQQLFSMSLFEGELIRTCQSSAVVVYILVVTHSKTQCMEPKQYPILFSRIALQATIHCIHFVVIFLTQHGVPSPPLFSLSRWLFFYGILLWWSDNEETQLPDAFSWMLE